MKELLPSYGVQVVEVARLSDTEGAVSASRVRALLDAGSFRCAAALTPEPVWPYLLAALGEQALRLELDTPLKPGLVGPDGNGAHKDMDCDLMHRSIDAIRPFFPRMAMAGSPEELRRLGLDAEAAMLAVNAHRGAIYALGLALNAAARTVVPACRISETAQTECLMQDALRKTAQGIFDHSLKDSEFQVTARSHGSVAREQYGAKGAREMASEGYPPLFTDWLPFYRSVKAFSDGLQRTLLRIMSTLDDTCIIHRVGYERAQLVKVEATALLEDFSTDGLRGMCRRYAAEGISPGGAADMLALTIFIESISTHTLTQKS